VFVGVVDPVGSGLGGEKSFGKTMAEVMRFAASNVQEGVVADSGALD
jgi:hypothetical protein